MKLHLDGARCLNACVSLNASPAELGKDFDTINLCFSKGLGCPVGSILMGSEKDIFQAIRLRKSLGGGMRQAGVLASCALVALEDWQDKLSVDHSNARYIGDLLRGIDELEVSE